MPDTPLRLRRLAIAVARHPDVWLEAGRLALAAAPAGWWRRPPFLPAPDPDYLQWRAVTAYGGSGEPGDGVEVGDDLVAFLRWRRRQRR